ncbi:MAG: hypothetical protein PHI35_01000 [Victivallaceae bacterium]|nr:hypothetical protein [Victivallaceae bacterium]
MSKPVAIDIGNVCVKIHPERFCAELGFSSIAEVPPELMYLEAELFECGKIDEAEFLKRFRVLTGSTRAEAELRQIFLDIIGEPVPGMADVISAMPERGFRPVLFSDVSLTHLELVHRRLPYTANLDGIYSFTSGARKNRDAMFEDFEQVYGKPALYIDDRAELIARGRDRGWRAEVFESAAQLDALLTSI